MSTGQRDVSLTDFKRNSADVIRRVKAKGEPVVVTVNGQPELVVQDVESYRRLLQALDRAEAIAGIRRGLDEVARGETQPAEEFFDDFFAKHGLPR